VHLDLAHVDEPLDKAPQAKAVEIDSLRRLGRSSVAVRSFVHRSLLPCYTALISPPAALGTVPLRVDFTRLLEALRRRLQYPRPDLAASLARQTGVDHGHDLGFGGGKWCILKEAPTPEGGIALTFIDIMERKQAEDELKASEKDARNILDTILDTFYCSGREGSGPTLGRSTG
jgi:PAS domain-containing protein